MPLIQITLVQGRDPEAVTECAREVARAVHKSLGAPLERIRVSVTEVPGTHWLVGDKSKAELDSAVADAGGAAKK
ncbi:tautomerase family protein [Ramlibacter sp.]|uniref:tautomerase family protein n=1 Tax=Ramlibacter sp. TaxID=1917967 RepID=UPI003D124189